MRLGQPHPIATGPEMGSVLLPEMAARRRRSTGSLVSCSARLLSEIRDDFQFDRLAHRDSRPPKARAAGLIQPMVVAPSRRGMMSSIPRRDAIRRLMHSKT